MNTDLQVSTTTATREAPAADTSNAKGAKGDHAPFSQHLEAAQSEDQEPADDVEEGETGTDVELDVELAGESDGGSVSDHGEGTAEPNSESALESASAGEQASGDEEAPSFEGELAEASRAAGGANDKDVHAARSVGSVRVRPTGANEPLEATERTAAGPRETASAATAVAGRPESAEPQAPTETTRAASTRAPLPPTEVADDWATRAMNNRARVVIGSGDDRVALLVALEKEGVRVALEASSQETADQARSSAEELERALGRHGKQLIELKTNSESEERDSAATHRATRRSIIA